MSLFVVQHKHAAETCPAGHPQMGPMLLKHLSPTNTSRFGIKVHGEAVVNGGHTFYLVLEAQGAEVVKEFMAPFYQAGTVEVWPASTCEQVVARAGC
ncbi:MAG: sulfite oxidase [Chloroflexi bacterium]|nr:sulfite oxidase [Chloroflexota bacterium]